MYVLRPSASCVPTLPAPTLWDLRSSESAYARKSNTTADVAVVEDILGLVFKVDIEAEPFRKHINKQN